MSTRSLSTPETRAKLHFGFGRRIGYLALSALAGWACGQIATLPTSILVAVRNSGGDQRLFLNLLVLGGFLAWGAWTFILCSVAAVFVALPIVLVLRPCLLVRYRLPIYFTSAMVAAGITLYHLRDFRDASASSRFLRFFEALPYGILAVVFSVVTAWIYLILCKRRLDAMERFEARTATHADRRW